MFRGAGNHVPRSDLPGAIRDEIARLTGTPLAVRLLDGSMVAVQALLYTSLFALGLVVAGSPAGELLMDWQTGALMPATIESWSLFAGIFVIAPAFGLRWRGIGERMIASSPMDRASELTFRTLLSLFLPICWTLASFTAWLQLAATP